jgi:hypothetical protein
MFLKSDAIADAKIGFTKSASEHLCLACDWDGFHQVKPVYPARVHAGTSK